jgi:hypothetical protein
MKFTKTLLLILAAMCLLTQSTFCKDSEEPLQSGEEYTEDEQAEREHEAEELKNANAEYFTRESFFEEYNQENPEHPEVQMAKKYFPTQDTTIDKERYKTLLKMYMDGTVHDEEIDEDIREEAHKQLEEFVESFIEQEAKEKDDFTVEDLFNDFIGGRFHDWLDKHHPENDSDIEPDL